MKYRTGAKYPPVLYFYKYKEKPSVENMGKLVIVSFDHVLRPVFCEGRKGFDLPLPPREFYIT